MRVCPAPQPPEGRGEGTPSLPFVPGSVTKSICTLTETTDTALAHLLLVSSAKDKSGDLEGFFQFPDTAHHDGDANDSWQIGAFNSGLKSLTTAPEKGGGQYANWTIFHEIGHSMGLKHTRQETDGLPPLETIGEAMDNERYSVMSYNGASNHNNYGHAVSYLALDVAALQALYGAPEYAATDSTYALLNARQAKLNLTEGDTAIGRGCLSRQIRRPQQGVHRGVIHLIRWSRACPFSISFLSTELPLIAQLFPSISRISGLFKNRK